MSLVSGVDFKLPVLEPGAADKILPLPELDRSALRENLENISADAVGNKAAHAAGGDMQRRIGQSRQNIPLPDAVLVLPGLFVPADPYKVTVCDVFQKQDAFPRQYRFKSHLAGFQIHMGQKSLSLFV